MPWDRWRMSTCRAKNCLRQNGWQPSMPIARRDSRDSMHTCIGQFSFPILCRRKSLSLPHLECSGFSSPGSREILARSPRPLDFEILRAASDRLSGTHDFASFAANRGKAAETTTRTIQEDSPSAPKGTRSLEFDGNGFLYRMVRMLTGTMVRVASQQAES